MTIVSTICQCHCGNPFFIVTPEAWDGDKGMYTGLQRLDWAKKYFFLLKLSVQRSYIRNNVESQRFFCSFHLLSEPNNSLKLSFKREYVEYAFYKFPSEGYRFWGEISRGTLHIRNIGFYENLFVSRNRRTLERHYSRENYRNKRPEDIESLVLRTFSW